MNSDGINPFETDSDVKRARVVALSDDQTHESMHNTLSEDEFENDGRDTDAKLTIDRSKNKCFITEKVDCIYANRTQAEV